MRLHSLTLSAFGSFSGRDTVDFDQLSATGLFLLHGPTGAGKTTILDAVSYALFGTVPGVRSAGEALRSHHAGAVGFHNFRLAVNDQAERPLERHHGQRFERRVQSQTPDDHAALQQPGTRTPA